MSSDTPRWPVVEFDKDYLDRVVAQAREKRPATALFFVEEWMKTNNKEMEDLEVVFQSKTGYRLERTLANIYKDLDNTVMSEVILQEFTFKSMITGVMTSSKMSTQSLNSPLNLLSSATSPSSGDFWRTQYEDLDEDIGSWTSLHFEDTSKSGFENELRRMLDGIDSTLPKAEKINEEWIKGCRLREESIHFVDSIKEALQLAKGFKQIEANDILQRWQQRIHSLRENHNPDILLKFLDIQQIMLTNLDLQKPLKELLLEKIKLCNRQHDFSSTIDAIRILESYASDSTSSEANKFHGITSLVHVEKGRLLWEQGKASHAIKLAEAVIKEIKDQCRLDSYSFDAFSSMDGKVTDQQFYNAYVLCKWLCCLGEWIFLSQLESFDNVICHMNNVDFILKQREFKNSTESLKIEEKFHYKFACYADHHYSSLLPQIEAIETKVESPCMDAKQNELDHIRSQLRDGNFSLTEEYRLHSQLNQETGLIKEDQRDLKDLKGNRDQCLTIALKHYSQSLEINNDRNLKIISRVLQLWFKNNHSEAVNEVIGRCIENIPSFKFLPILDQIVSRITNVPSDVNPGPFLTVLYDLVWKLCKDHPYHVLPRIIALRNEGLDVRQAQSSHVFRKIFDYGKISGARELLQLCETKYETTRGIIRQMDLLIGCYIKIALICENLGSDQSSTILFPPNLRHQVQNLDHIPVLSTELPVQPSAVYEFPHFQSFGEEIHFEKGLSRVKVIQVFDSLGKEFKEGIKSINDVHQETVIQQIFRVANELLLGDIESRNQRLAMQTYNVISLTPTIGVFQWVKNTIQISEYLIGPDKNSGAHVRYHRDGMWSFQKCYDEMEDSFSSDRTQTFLDVCSQFPPVLRHFFVENSSCALDWYKKRTSFTKSVAVSSILGYIVGLGDRHLENILIRKDTCEVVHVDLGVAFDQGKFLPTPEVVPFRLTREIVDGMGLYGVIGTMKKCCELTLKVMRDNQDCLEMICDVFVNNPLSTWTFASLESQSLSSKLGYNLGEQLHDHSEYKAARITRIIRQKLQGVGESRILSVEGQVQKLIQDAQDPNKLSKMQRGWAPWL